MNYTRFLSQAFGALFYGSHQPIVRSYKLRSQRLGRKVKVSIYRPSIFPMQPMRLLLCLDGQDLPRMDVKEILIANSQAHPRQPMLFVGIHAENRIEEYGTADRPDYQERGAQSRSHQDFIIQELLPWINRRYSLRPQPKYHAIAGFSLGGLHAFDLAWQHSRQFASVGVFSGALWWRSKPFDKTKPDANRVVHDYVSAVDQVPSGFRAWLMAGTEDEKEDRNNNGIIDAIDDTIQLQALLEKRGCDTPHQLSYHQVEGGRHEPETWGKAMPHFLNWWLA